MKKYYELHVQCYMRENINYENTFEMVGNLTNCAMIEDSYLSPIHNAIGFKNYCISGLYACDKDGVYKKGKTYSFMIRSYDKQMIERFKIQLMKQNNSYIVVLMASIKEWKHRIISELQTYTPCIVTLKEDERIDIHKKYWTKEYNKDLLIQKIENNLMRKYKYLYKNDIDACMINSIEIRNDYYKAIKYKGLTILGNQINIKVNMDKNSQELANLAIVQGIGEKNSCLAMGFCKGVYMD